MKNFISKSGKVYNYKISTSNDMLYITPKNKFISLSELVEFYKKHASGEL